MKPRIWKDCPTCEGGGFVLWWDEDDSWLPKDSAEEGEPCPTCAAHYGDIDLEREACAQACIGAYTTGYDYDDIDVMKMKFVGEEEGHHCKHGQFAPEGRCEECCADAIRAREIK